MERKTFEFRGYSETETGVFGGYASTWDNVDAGGDVVARGAFAKALPAFLRDGFVAHQHRWDEPIAIPLQAHEDEVGLWLAAQFHSTPEAQRVRTVVRERQQHGLRTGLSIGYDVEESVPVRGVRLLKVLNPLYEISVVSVPMNRQANIVSVKSLDPTCEDDRCVLDALAEVERDNREAGLRDVLRQTRALGVAV